MMAELLAPLIALMTYPGIFAGKAATFYNDNLVAVSALINGASRAAELNTIGLAFALSAHRLNCPYWVEWVPSASNIADDGSRRGSAERTAQSLGIPVTSSKFSFKVLADFLALTPAQLVRHIMGNGGMVAMEVD